ncbi:MAG TPA: hypothetical protein VLC71_00860 [Thermomonas sp.]|nr:hypothetical protein [Thermomonas sp.]
MSDRRSLPHPHPALVVTAGLVAVVLAWLGHASTSPLPVGLRDTAGGIAIGMAVGFMLMIAVRRIPALRERILQAGSDAVVAAVHRQYLREFLPAMGAYVLAVFASLLLLKNIDAPATRALVALLPVLPIAFALRAIMRYVRNVDEMQQRIELEAIAFATAFVSLVYLGGGFLQLARVIDLHAGVAMAMVFPLVCGVYGIAKLVVARRFR